MEIDQTIFDRYRGDVQIMNLLSRSPVRTVRVGAPSPRRSSPAAEPQRVLDDRDQDQLGRLAAPHVTQDYRHAGVDVEGRADPVHVVPRSAVEAVDGHDERNPALLEVVDRREAV